MKLLTLLRSNEYVVIFSGDLVLVIVGNRTEHTTLEKLNEAERAVFGEMKTRKVA